MSKPVVQLTRTLELSKELLTEILKTAPLSSPEVIGLRVVGMSVNRSGPSLTLTLEKDPADTKVKTV